MSSQLSGTNRVRVMPVATWHPQVGKWSTSPHPEGKEIRRRQEMIPTWAVITMLKYPWADFCLDCQYFVMTKKAHCWGNYRNHIVVRLTK